jgi:hypothetical protein
VQGELTGDFDFIYFFLTFTGGGYLQIPVGYGPTGLYAGSIWSYGGGGSSEPTWSAQLGTWHHLLVSADFSNGSMSLTLDRAAIPAVKASFPPPPGKQGKIFVGAFDLSGLTAPVKVFVDNVVIDIAD